MGIVSNANSRSNAGNISLNDLADIMVDKMTQRGLIFAPPLLVIRCKSRDMILDFIKTLKILSVNSHQITLSFLHFLCLVTMKTSDFIWDFGKLPFPSYLGKYIIKIGKISTKIHEIEKIKAIFGLGRWLHLTNPVLITTVHPIRKLNNCLMV